MAHLNSATTFKMILIACFLAFRPAQSRAEIVTTEVISESDVLRVAANRRATAMSRSHELQQAYREGRYDECRRLWRSARQIDRELPATGLIMTWLHLHAGRLADAKKELEAVFADQPDDPQVALTAAHLAITQNDYVDAVLHARRARDLPLPRSWNLDQQRSFAAEVLDTLAMALEQTEAWEEARIAIADLMKVRRGILDDLIRLARSEYLAGDSKAAEETLADALQRDEAKQRWDNVPSTTLVLGGFARRKGDLTAADHYFRQAIVATPAHPQPRIALASLMLATRKPIEALRVLDASVEAEVSDPLLDQIRGDALLTLGRHDEALKAYETVLQAAPEDWRAQRSRVLAWLSSDSLQRHSDAKELAQQLALRHPKNAEAVALLGFVHVKENRPDLARTLLARATELTPNVSADIAYFLAELAMLGKPDIDAAERFLGAARDGSIGVFLLSQSASDLVDRIDAIRHESMKNQTDLSHPNR